MSPSQIKLRVLDFLLGSIFVFLFIRGWARGFVKEAMDLLGVIVGLAVAFRLSPAAGAVVGGIIGSSPTVSRVVGGLLLFVLIGGAAALLAHYLNRIARLPGLALGNRLTGAGLALAWGAFLATLVLSVVSLFRLPPAVAEHLDESSVASTLTDPAGVPQAVFSYVSGDRVLGVLLSLDELIGGRRAIIDGSDSIELEPADSSAVTVDPGAASELFEALNEERAEADMSDLRWSAELAEVARRHAVDMYTNGFFSHRSPATGDATARVSSVTGRYAEVGENLALAVDTVEAHEGLVGSPGHYATMTDGRYTAVGVTSVRGPLGLMVVQVFGG